MTRRPHRRKWLSKFRENTIKLSGYIWYIKAESKTRKKLKKLVSFLYKEKLQKSKQINIFKIQKKNRSKEKSGTYHNPGT